MRSHWLTLGAGATLLAVIVFIAACLVDNNLYCDAAKACADPARPYCDQVKHECVSTKPGDMGGGIDFAGVDIAGLDLAGACGSAADCTQASSPICELTCRPCASPADDAQCAMHSSATPRCHVNNGTCVQCRDPGDCADVNNPFCDSTGACRPCKAHSECASAVCDLTAGQCVAAASICYVDNRGMVVLTCENNVAFTKDGVSFTSAYCDISSCFTAGKPYIAVKGSLTQYNRLQFSGNKTLTIVGPGKGAIPPAAITSGTNPLVDLNPGGSNTLQITLDGLHIGAASVPQNVTGIACAAGGSSTSALTVRDSVVQSNLQGGIAATGACALTVRRSTIRNNGAGAVTVANPATYIFDSNMIVNNTGALAIVLGTNTPGTFAFNTVAGNANGTTNPGGIDCSSIAKDIQHSIVAGNSRGAAGAGSQFFGSCNLLTVVTGPDTFTNAITDAPELVDTSVSGYDAHLKTVAGMATAPNVTCCVDKIPSAAGLPAVDVDGTARPKGASWDIGAHEVQ